MKPVRFAILIVLFAAGVGAAVARANLNSSNRSDDEALIRKIDALWSNAADDKDLEVRCIHTPTTRLCCRSALLSRREPTPSGKRGQR